MNKSKREKGIALLLTMIILSAAMLIAMLITTIVVIQFKLSSDVSYSMVAIYAADSGVEQKLYQIRQMGDTAPIEFSLFNGATVSVTVTGTSPNFTIKSLGSYHTVKRQFEVSF